MLEASADGDEALDAASHAGRKSKATWQMGQERKASTGPEQQQCSVNLLEHCGGE